MDGLGGFAVAMVVENQSAVLVGVVLVIATVLWHSAYAQARDLGDEFVAIGRQQCDLQGLKRQSADDLHHP